MRARILKFCIIENPTTRNYVVDRFARGVQHVFISISEKLAGASRSIGAHRRMNFPMLNMFRSFTFGYVCVNAFVWERRANPVLEIFLSLSFFSHHKYTHYLISSLIQFLVENEWTKKFWCIYFNQNSNNASRPLLLVLLFSDFIKNAFKYLFTNT